MRRIVLAKLALLILPIAGGISAAQAGQVVISYPFGAFHVETKSLWELGWDRVVRQQYDFSCGSAAVATLLTYHYERPTTEAQVFEAMIRNGDKRKIQTHGFSMLDMKRYLDHAGLDSDGFKIALDDFINIGLPAITMVNTNGYRHFVVIKGIDEDNILVGDPAAGTVVLPKENFAKIWTGTVLGARNKLQVARQNFNHQGDWSVRPEAPLGNSMQRSGLGTSLLTLPGRNELGR